MSVGHRSAEQPTPEPVFSSARGPYSALQQRLLYMARDPERDWIDVIENVPRWPSAFCRLPPSAWADAGGYGPSAGQDVLRAAVAARESSRHGLGVRPDHVLVSNGAFHGLSLVFRLLARPGARALCQAPLLEAVPATLRSLGYQVDYLPTDAAGIDLSILDRVDPRSVTLVYLNSPHNPTGWVIGAEQLERLRDFCGSSVALVMDAVYDDFVFMGRPQPSVLRGMGDWAQTFHVNSMSKNYGAPGLRVGWVVTAEDNVQALAGRLEQESICVSGVAQRIAASLIERGNGALVEVVAQGRQFLEERLLGIGLRYCPPMGGCHAFVDLEVDDVEALCDMLLVREGLGLVSASNYDACEGSWIRLPMGVECSVLERALAALQRGLGRARGIEVLP